MCVCMCVCSFFFCVVSGGMCAHTCGYVCVWRAGWPRVCAYVFFFFESGCVCYTQEIESERGSTACACVCACVRFFCVVSGGMCAHTWGMCVCGGRDGPECARMFFFFWKVGVFATRPTALLFPVSQYIDTVVSVMIITITTDRIYVSCFPIDKYTVVSLSPRSALGRSASLRSLALRSASGRVSSILKSSK